MPTPGENVIVDGRFRLNHKLGQGGMGSVWHATQLGLDAPCAIKFIEGEFAALPDMQARFEREAKAAAALRSPHVVQVIDHSTWEGIPFIAMELLVGEDLSQRIASRHTLTPDETLTILGQVCRALSKAHAIGIVHRDLKPENIFLVQDDDREIAKILDFGIAKNITLEVGSTTKTGSMMGTPFYMSPEQAQGTRTVDARSDLWAIAVIAYQCLTGQLPFESEALGELLMKIMVAPAPIPSQVAAVPAGFDAWFLKATSREPAERFQTAKELIDALAVAFGHGPPAGTIMPRSRAPEPVGPRPVPAATLHAHGDRDSDVVAAGVPKRSSGIVLVALGAGFLLAGIGIAVAVAKRGPDTAAPDPTASTQPSAKPAVTAITQATTAGTNASPASSSSTSSAAVASPASASASASASAAWVDPRKNVGAATGTGVAVRPRPTAQTSSTAVTAPSVAPVPTKDPHDLGF